MKSERKKTRQRNIPLEQLEARLAIGSSLPALLDVLALEDLHEATGFAPHSDLRAIRAGTENLADEPLQAAWENGDRQSRAYKPTGRRFDRPGNTSEFDFDIKEPAVESAGFQRTSVDPIQAANPIPINNAPTIPQLSFLDASIGAITATASSAGPPTAASATGNGAAATSSSQALSSLITPEHELTPTDPLGNQEAFPDFDSSAASAPRRRLDLRTGEQDFGSAPPGSSPVQILGENETTILCSSAEGLEGWTITENGGSISGRGSVTFEDGDLVLAEGDSFLVTLSRTVTVPENPTTLSFEFASNFDSSDPGFVNDAFEAALVDSSGNSVVQTISDDRDAFFNVSEEVPALGGTNTVINGNRVALDISRMFPGTEATLIFRLVNNDSDVATTANIFCDQGDAQAPIAVPDSYNTQEDTTLNVTQQDGVLDNDLGTPAVAILETTTSRGSLDLQADGSFEYIPGEDFNGSDSFTYRASDGQQQSAPALVTITIDAVNDPPDIDPDEYSVNEDDTLVVPANLGVLDNDNDVESALFVAANTDPSDGTLYLQSDGSFEYRPDEDFFGTDTFSYRASDGLEESLDTTVTIVVGALNDAPIAVPDEFSVREDRVLNVSANLGLLDNDSDVDSSFTVSSNSQPSNGDLEVAQDGSFRYEPDRDFFGTDSFSYQISDGVDSSEPATVTLIVRPANDRPKVTVRNIRGQVGSAVTASVRFNDPDLTDLHGITVFWGDGATSSVSSARPRGNGLVKVSHIYDTPGRFEIRTDVEDQRGAVGSDVATAIIKDEVVIGQPRNLFRVPGNPGETASVVFTLTDRRADFRNELGIYLADRENGAIDGFTPGDDGFSAAALSSTNQQVVFDGTDRVGTVRRIELPAGSVVAPYMVQNASTEQFLRKNPTGKQNGKPRVFFPFQQANFDQFNHFRKTEFPNGAARFEAEDFDGGGDRDFNDLVFFVLAVPEDSGSTKFFVVDSRADANFRYDAEGTPSGNSELAAINKRSRGATSNAAGNTVWSIDSSGRVFVYNAKGAVEGHWRARGVDDSRGLATDGTAIWIVDRRSVHRFDNAAGRLRGARNSSSSFPLAPGNKNPTGLATDGQLLWVTDSRTDEVFVYSASGKLRGQWKLDKFNRAPVGITNEPGGGMDLWVVDRYGLVFHYPGATRQREGRRRAAAVFPLGPGNRSPQGIADPPPVVSSSATAELVQAGETVLISGQANGQESIATVTIAGSPVEVLDAGGNFFSRFEVPPGTSTLDVQATNVQGETGNDQLQIRGVTPGEEVDLDLVFDVSDSFEAVFARTSFDDETDILYTELAIENVGSFSADNPFFVGITNLSEPTVRVRDAAGTTPDGLPFYDFTELIPGQDLAPGDVTGFVNAAFFNSQKVPFTFDLVFLAKLNETPQITSVPVVEGSIGVAYQYDVDAVDPDDDALTFSLLAAPPAMTIDQVTGLISWTPLESDRGVQDVLVRVEDGRGGAATQRFAASVADARPNRPPVILSNPIVQARANTPYNYDVEAVDPDNDTLRFGRVNFPAGMTIEPGTGLVLWTPTNDQIGLQTVNFEVADGRGGTASQAYQVEVIGPLGNLAPVFVSDPIIRANLSEDYSYASEAIDLDQDTVSYGLLEFPTGMTVDSASGLVLWPSSDLVLGSHAVTIEARDGRGGVDQQSFTVDVIDNQAPRITSEPITEHVVRSDGAGNYIYDVDAIDPDGDTLAFSLLSFPEGMSIDTSTGLIAFPAGANDAGVHEVSVLVEDPNGGLDQQDYSLTVFVNRPPRFVSDPVTQFHQPNPINPASGTVDPDRVDLDLERDQVADETVSITLGDQIPKVDVFLLFDDTGSFSDVAPTLIDEFPAIIAELQQQLPEVDLAFGVGRFEDFSPSGLADRPFVLGQSILPTDVPGFEAAISAALNRTSPGGGGDGPETLIEGLFQLATGIGFDGNQDGDTTDSGVAGLGTTQTSPEPGGDVPAFATFSSIDRDYAFELISFETVQEAEFGELIEVSIAGLETEAFQFVTTDDNQEVFVDVVERIGPLDIHIVDPFGDTLVDAALVQDLESLTLPAQGNYVVLLQGQRETVDVELKFALFTKEVSISPMSLNNIVSGEIGKPGATDQFEFSLAVETIALFDSLTDADQLELSLSGPGGQLFAPRSFDGLDGSGGETSVRLEVGEYLVTVQGGRDNTGAYEFRLLDVSTAVPLASNSVVTGELSPANESDLFRFSANRGDRFFFDRIDSGGPAPGNWKLIDPRGELVFSDIYRDISTIALPRTGTYTLSIEGSPSATTNSSYSFSVIPEIIDTQSLNPNTATSGSINQPGKVNEFSFELTNPTVVVMDILAADNPDLLWSLTGPAGLEVTDRRLRQSDGSAIANSALSLVSGQYTLGVVGTGDDTGSYQFQLLNLDSAVSVTPGTPFSGTLDPPSETDLFRFDGAVGDRFFFDSINSTDISRNARWRLLDPFGEAVFSQQVNTSGGLVQLIADGTYIVAIEGGLTEPLVGSYTLNVQPEVTSETPLTIGSLVNGSVDTAGEKDTFLFSLADRATLYFDSLTNSNDIVWTLNGPPGTPVDQRSLARSDALLVDPFLKLPSGDYRLTVQGNSGATGPYAFRLLDITTAVAATIGTAINDQLNPANETDLFVFSANAGDEVSFEPRNVAPDIRTARMRLLDPFAQIVFSRALSQNVTETLPFTGDYTLLVEGEPDFNVPAGYTINTTLLGNTAPPALPSGTPLQLGNQIDGSIQSAGEQDIFNFRVADDAFLYFDALTDTNSIEWTLQGPKGIEVANRRFDQTDSASIASPALPLVPGDYAVTVQGRSNATGGYSFRLLDFASATPISPGTPFSGQLDPGNESDLFRFDASIGEDLFIDIVSDSGFSSSDRVKLIDPFGELVVSVSPRFDRSVESLPSTGTYTLILAGFRSSSAVVNYTVNVQPEVISNHALSINALTIESVDAAQAIDRYSFSQAAPALLYFDSLTDSNQLRWSLNGPSGTVVDQRLFQRSDAGSVSDPVLRLVPGDYLLDVQGIGDTLEAYAFRLLDLNDALSINAGDPLSITFDPANETRLFQLDAAAGDRLFHDVEDGGGLGVQSRLKVIDPFGNALSESSLTADRDNLLLPSAGTYTIAAEAAVQNTAPGPLQVNFRPIDPTPQILSLGTPVAGALTVPGDEAQFTFSLHEEALLLFDSQTNERDLRWSLESPIETIVPNTQFSRDDRLISLAADDYTLKVDGLLDHTGPFAFALSNTQQGVEITPGTSVTGALDPGNEADLFRFNGNEGERFFFDIESASGILSAGSWQLLDPFGQVLFDESITDDVDTIALPNTGGYSLLLQGAIGDTGVGSYGFRIQPEQVTVASLQPGARNSDSLTTAGAVDRYTFSLTEPTLIHFDARTESADVKWSIAGQSGNLVQDRQFTVTDSRGAEQPALFLQSGDYTLTVTGVGDFVGDYEFAVLDLEAATQVLAGSQISDQLSPANESDAFRFELTNPARILFDIATTANQRSATFRLIGPFGDTIIDNAITEDGLALLTTPGAYSILVEGAIGETNAVDYTIDVVQLATFSPPSPTGEQLAPNTVTQRLLAGGTANVFVFPASAGEIIYLDGIAGQPDGINARLVAPSGTVLFEGLLLDDSDPLVIRETGIHQLAIVPPDSLLPVGNLGGAGFRTGALPIILAATDIGTVFEPEGIDPITGVSGITVPLEEFLDRSRQTTLNDAGAGIQQTVNALNSLGALVIGLADSAVEQRAPRQPLEALSKLTGAINSSDNPIDSGVQDDPVDPGDPLFFLIGEGGAGSVVSGVLSTSVVSAISTAITSVEFDVDLAASDLTAPFENLSGVVSGVKPGATAEFDARFTGDGTRRNYDLLFLRAGTGVVLGSIPATINNDYFYLAEAVDPDFDDLTFSLVQSGPGATIDAATGLVHFEPPSAGTFPFTLRVEDGNGGVDTQSYDLVVTDGLPNEPPLFTSQPPTGAVVGQTLTYQATAQDPNDDPLSFFILGAPDGAVIDTTTGEFRFTPGPAEPGLQNVVLRAVDGRGGFDTQRFAIDVRTPLPGTIQGVKFHDLNANGERDIDEPPLEDVVVFLDQDRNSQLDRGEPFARTDINGEYEFADLVPGNYQVAELVPDGFLQTAPEGAFHQVTVAEGETVDQLNFGNQSLVLSDINFPPEFASEPPETAIVNQRLLYQASAEDPNQDTLVFDAVVVPAGMAIDAETGILVWTSNENQLGSNDVVLRVQDGRGGVDLQAFTLNVVDPNTPPRITSTPPTNGVSDIPYAYKVRAQDGEDDPLTFSLDVFPAGMTIDSATGLIRWVPNGTQAGANAVRAVVGDDSGLTDTQSFTVQVASGPPNDPPVITSAPPGPAVVGSPYEYRVVAEDPNGDPIRFRLDGPVQGMSIDPATGLIQFTPSADQEGQIPTTVLATDGKGRTAGQSFQLPVVSVATTDPPVITSLPPGPAQINNPYRYQVEANDPSGDPISFTLTENPTGMAVDPTGLLTWTPVPGQEGNNPVTIEVADPFGGFAQQSFVLEALTVAANNDPQIVSTPVGPAVATRPYQYDVDAIDPDGDVLSFSLNSFPEGMSIDSQTGLITWLARGDQLGTHNVQVRVGDGRGGQETQSFDLDVVSDLANSPPVITSLPRTTAAVQSAFFYRLEVADPDNDPLSFFLKVAPEGMSVDDDGVVLWTPEPNQLGLNDVEIRVEDGRGGFAEQAFTVATSSLSENTPPTIVSVPPLNATVGVDYIYDAVAVDPDLDPLNFVLEQGPIGMSIDPDFGLVRWTPTAEQIGLQQVIIQVLDGQAGFAEQNYSVGVNPVNQPPIISSTPPTSGFVNSPYRYSVRGVDPESDTLTFALTTAPAGMSINGQSGQIEWTPDGTQVGANAVRVRVSDDRGGQVEQAYEVVISEETPNEPPIVTSTPVTVGRVGFVYQYQVAATHPEGGALLFGLAQFPTGMVIDQQSGLVQWVPGQGDIGINQVTVTATDPSGAIGAQSYDISVREGNEAPTFTVDPEFQAIVGTTYLVDVKANDPDDDPITFRLDSVAPGMTIDELGRIVYEPQLDDVGTHEVVIVVTDSFGAGGLFRYDLDVVVDDIAPALELLIKDSPANIGVPVAVLVTATDNVAVADLTLTVDGDPLTLSGDGRATLSFDEIGDRQIVANAVDPQGNSASATATLQVVDLSDVDAPVVELRSPEPNDVITIFTDVVGTVRDDNLISFKVEAARANGPFRLLFEGTDQVEDDVLGTFDPSILMNDPYTLRLTAEDAGGNVSSTQTIVQVAGDLKVGHFTMEFVDLSLPTTGVPTTVVRSYNSLERDRSGDFGFGWQLELTDVELTTDLPDFGFEDFELFAPFRDNTRVYVTLPGGRREGFTFRPIPKFICVLGACIERFRPSFRADPGVKSKLIVPPEDLKRIDGEFFSLSGSIPYNPASAFFGRNYTLRTRNQFRFDIDPVANKVKRIVDRNGNETIPRKDSIVSSSGRTVQLERDPEDRVTAVIDPLGARIEYEYDARGDLVATTDRAGNRIEYVYDDDHLVIDIVDPLGRTVERNDYDDKGRLVGRSDADGNQIQLIHDSENRTETQIDPLGNSITVQYDDAGNVVRVTDPVGDVHKFSYDEDGNVLTATDPAGNTTAYTYNDNGDRLSETTPLGDVITTSYDGFGAVLSITDPLGNTTRMTYDRRGNLLTLTDAVGAVTTLAYDSRGNVLSTTDALGNATTFTYNRFGEVLTETNALGHVTSFSYDENGELLTTTRNRTLGDGTVVAETVTREYDVLGRPSALIDQAGNRFEMDFDFSGKLTRVADPLGSEFTIQHNARGKVERVIDSEGGTVEYEHDPIGRVTQIVDPEGRVSSFEYDGRGRVTKEENPIRGAVTLEYGAIGMVSRVTDQRGNVRSLTQDPLGRLIQADDSAGETLQFEYNAANLLTKTVDPLGNEIQAEYDPNGRPISTTFRDGSVLVQDYDLLGRITSKTDPLGRTSGYTYDAIDRLIAITNPLGDSTQFSYDEAHNLTSIVEANGSATEFEYDSLGRLIKRTLPSGVFESRTYDATGKVESFTDFNGNTSRFFYGDETELIRIEYGDGSESSFVYDEVGPLVSTTDPSGTTSYETDAGGRLTAVTNPLGERVSFAYDASGKRTEVTTAAGTTRYSYDLLGRVVSVTDPDSLMTNYVYDAAPNLTQVEYPNGVTTELDYDAAHRPTLQETSNSLDEVLSSFSYTYDDAGNIASVLDHDGIRVDYKYDALDRIVEEFIQNPVSGDERIQYTYDSVGNRLTRTGDSGSIEYQYDENSQLTHDGTNSYEYDANGNLTRILNATEETTFTYNTEDNLVRVETERGAQNDTVEYVYAGDVRLQKIVNGSEVTNYLVDYRPQLEHVLLETDGDGNIQAAYNYGLDLLSQKHGDSTFFTHHDVTGSVRQLTDSSGAASDSYRYDSFGTVQDQTGSTPNPFLFKGEQLDNETNRYFMRARYYDPELGRFLERDPALGDPSRPATFYPYTFVENNPLKFSDPTGRTTVFEVLTAQAIISSISALAATSAVVDLFPPPVTDEAKQFRNFSGIWFQGTAGLEAAVGPLELTAQFTFSRALGIPVVAKHLEVVLQVITFPNNLIRRGSIGLGVFDLDNKISLGNFIRNTLTGEELTDADFETAIGLFIGALNRVRLGFVDASLSGAFGATMVRFAPDTAQLDNFAAGTAFGVETELGPAEFGFEVSSDIGIELDKTRPVWNGLLTFPSFTISLGVGTNLAPIDFDIEVGQFVYFATRISSGKSVAGETVDAGRALADV